MLIGQVKLKLRALPFTLLLMDKLHKEMFPLNNAPPASLSVRDQWDTVLTCRPLSHHRSLMTCCTQMSLQLYVITGDGGTSEGGGGGSMSLGCR